MNKTEWVFKVTVVYMLVVICVEVRFSDICSALLGVLVVQKCC